VKAGAVKKAAEAYSSEQLAAAIEALSERGEELLEVEGEDEGERLTHLLLAQRVRGRVDEGVPLKEAFRAEMAAVRGVLTNG
jgi:hypothetical protein